MSTPTGRSMFAAALALVIAACGSAAQGSPGDLHSVSPSIRASSGASPTTSPQASASPTAAASPAPPSPSPIALLPELPVKPVDAATAARYQRVLDDLVAKDHQPDAIAAVITPAGSWAGAAGSDGPNARRARPTDEFWLASVTKPMLAALILRLVEQGKMRLDAPLATYLGDMGADANGATVRQALAMHSGLGDTPEWAPTKALAACDHPWSREEVVATIPEPFTTPGPTYQYSNPTYKLLSFAAERAAGQPLVAAFRSLVFDPVHADRLVLQGTSEHPPKPWALPIAGHEGDLALSRYGTGGTLPCLAYSTLSLGASAAAGDAPTLARWAWGLFAGSIVSGSNLAQMTAGVDGDGLGIEQILDYPGEVAYGHGGSGPGYAAQLLILPARQAVIVLFINNETADLPSAAKGLMDALTP